MEDVRSAIPAEFWERMKKILGEDFEKFYNSYEDENVHALRFNPLKCDEALKNAVKDMFCDDKVPWCEDGYYYDNDKHPGRNALHEMGLYYIQEPSAMVVGSLLGAKPGDKVLDLCAAPGGKTTHIAGQLGGKGLLVSNEIDAARAKILSRNVERMGIKNCIVTNNSPDELSSVFCGFFDRIVVDSPCSGEGMFKKEEAAVANWSQGNVEMCSERSKTIVDEAVRMLSPGGVMVYSTCTFAVEEDEYIIKYILEKYPFMKLEPPENPDGFSTLSKPVCETDFFDTRGGASAVFRIWPHVQKGEGHFAARLVKNAVSSGDTAACAVTGAEFETVGSLPESDRAGVKDRKKQGKKSLKKIGGQSSGAGYRVPTKSELEAVKDFIKDCIITEAFSADEESIRMMRDTVWLLPDVPMSVFAGARTVRCGIELGIIKKDRFEPGHALAMALNNSQVKSAHETDRPEVFLEGNTLECENSLKGWVLVTYKGLPLGWGKASGGVIKNHYPKGLRRTGVEV